MKRPPAGKQTLGYVAVLAAVLTVAIISGWTAVASQIDKYAYDWMFRLHPPSSGASHSMILAIDDATFNSMGGVRRLSQHVGQGV